MGSAAAAVASGQELGGAIKRKSSVLLGIHVVGALLMFTYSVALARLLGRDAYGVFSYVENIPEVLLPVVLLGFPQVLVRYVSIYHLEGAWGRLKALRRTARAGSLAVAAVVAGVSWAVYRWSAPGPVPPGSPVLVIGLVLLPVMALLHLDQSALQGLRAPIVAMTPNQLVRPLLAIGATLVLWRTARLDVETALLGLLASVLCTEIITAVAARRWLRAAGADAAAPAEFRSLRRWLGMSWILLVIGVSRQLLHRVNIFVIGALATAGDIGVYNIGFQAAKFIGFAIASIGVVSAPIVAGMFHARELGKVQAVFDDAVRWVTIVAVPIAAGFLLFGEYILGLFGAAYQDGYPAFATLVVAQLVGALTGPTASMLTMAGDQKWLLASLIAGAVVNLSVSVVTVPAHGALGGAVASLSGIAVANVVMLWVLRRKYGLRLRLVRARARA